MTPHAGRQIAPNSPILIANPFAVDDVGNAISRRTITTTPRPPNQCNLHKNRPGHARRRLLFRIPLRGVATTPLKRVAMVHHGGINGTDRRRPIPHQRILILGGTTSTSIATSHLRLVTTVHRGGIDGTSQSRRVRHQRSRRIARRLLVVPTEAIAARLLRQAMMVHRGGIGGTSLNKRMQRRLIWRSARVAILIQSNVMGIVRQTTTTGHLGGIDGTDQTRRNRQIRIAILTEYIATKHLRRATTARRGGIGGAGLRTMSHRRLTRPELNLFPTLVSSVVVVIVIVLTQVTLLRLVLTRTPVLVRQQSPGGSHSRPTVARSTIRATSLPAVHARLIRETLLMQTMNLVPSGGRVVDWGPTPSMSPMTMSVAGAVGGGTDAQVPMPMPMRAMTPHRMTTEALGTATMPTNRHPSETMTMTMVMTPGGDVVVMAAHLPSQAVRTLLSQPIFKVPTTPVATPGGIVIRHLSIQLKTTRDPLHYRIVKDAVGTIGSPATSRTIPVPRRNGIGGAAPTTTTMTMGQGARTTLPTTDRSTSLTATRLLISLLQRYRVRSTPMMGRVPAGLGSVGGRGLQEHRLGHHRTMTLSQRRQPAMSSVHPAPLESMTMRELIDTVPQLRRLSATSPQGPGSHRRCRRTGRVIHNVPAT